MNKAQELAEKVLNYWFAIEFLTQDKFPNIYDSMNKAKKQKEKIARGEPNKTKQLTTFIKLEIEDMDKDLFAFIEKEVSECGMKTWGNLTFYIGKVLRDACIEEIAKVIKLSPEEFELQPEKTKARIAIASFQLAPDGTFVEKSFSLSPVLWALKKLHDTDGNLSEHLKAKEYSMDGKSVEDRFFDKNIDRKASSDVSESDSGDDDIQITSAVEAVNLNTVKELYEFLADEYVRNILHVSDEDSDACEEVYAFSFQMFADEDAKDKEDDDNYLGLSRDYFSNDINLVLEKVRDDKLVQKGTLTEDLMKYIEISTYRASDTIDFISCRDKDLNLKKLNEILKPDAAPLGKWPSRFMPALMQEVAINAVTYGTKDVTDGNGRIFSVNGPPGTGKTTLLKEIIVGNIVDRAILLSDYNNPDDAFEAHNFLHGDKANHAYSQYVPKWYALKNDEINNYGILVTSSNNAAVENISKELPKSMLDDLKPLPSDSEEHKTLLQEIQALFDPEKSGLVETTNTGKEYNDIYFTNLARSLVSDESAWGLIAAPLGKRPNLKDFYYKVLIPIDRDFYKNSKSAAERVASYLKVRDEFKAQLRVVYGLRDNLAFLRDAVMRRADAKRRWEELSEQSRESIALIREQINEKRQECISLQENRNSIQTEMDRQSEIIRDLAEATRGRQQEKNDLYDQTIPKKILCRSFCSMPEDNLFSSKSSA